MRKSSALMVLALAAATSATAFARTVPGGEILPLSVDPRAPGVQNDLPARAPQSYLRADTIRYGYVQTLGGELYAVEGEMWTFDHGAGSIEGWYAVDVSANDQAYFKRITAADWSTGGNTVAAPILDGTASLWVGIYENEALDLCWAAGLGYGNSWCQRVSSPNLTYSGTGDVSIGFRYFNDTELNFDYSKVVIRLLDGTETSKNGAGYTDKIGVSAGLPPPGATAAITAFNSDFQGQTTWNLVFEFTSDGGWSDEDGAYVTEHGPFGADNVTISGGTTASYDFESGLQGWTVSTCGGFGTFFDVVSLGDYTLVDPCSCELAGNVLKFHNAAGNHPYGQHVEAYSPPADKSALDPSFNKILGEWDMYAEMPQANGVFYRPGWNFFPFICPQTGASQWSGRAGQGTFFYVGADPACFFNRNAATDWGIPGSCELVSFVFEVYSSCDAFGIASTICTGVTNFTPIIDNVQIGVTGVPNAPPISFEVGLNYQDGFGQGLVLSTTNAGNADVTYDLHRDNPTPDKLGDSLQVNGPIPTASTKWEAKMWWRIRREGPGQASIPNYATWKTAIADGLSIVGATGQFTFGKMDSLQVGTQVAKNKFVSEFREDDDDFATENTDNNEMIRDGILAPGTQIEYFCSSNYIANAQNYLLPDTAGKFYSEFEILPSYRLDAGTPKFPCILCVDLNTGNQFFVENSLNVILNGAGPGAPVPNPTRWDRYDYNDASSNWNAPLARSIGGNNGTTLPQLLGYRQIMLYTGGSIDGAMENPDFTLMGDWLSAIVCDGNLNRQGFIGNGDNLATLLVTTNPSFLVNYLGASAKCDAYNIVNCGPNPADESFCVRVNNASGSQFTPDIAYDVYGNWCPQKFIFDVLLTTTGGIGNRVYNDYDAVPAANTNYAQVVKTVTGAASDNYRTVLDGYAYNKMSERDATLECVGDSAHIVTAVYSEIFAGLEWIFGGAGNIPNLCSSGCVPTDVDGDTPVIDGGLVNRLYQNSPNPFNPRTSIKFSLAAAGPAELVIYDVNGRKVKTLVKGAQTAGAHDVVWDGTNDLGQKVGSGVFWSQLTVGEFSSNKKMVILK